MLEITERNEFAKLYTCAEDAMGKKLHNYVSLDNVFHPVVDSLYGLKGFQEKPKLKRLVSII